MTTTSLAAKLHDITGFQSLFTGIFGGGKAKKSFARYSEASKKGVYKLHKLRHAEHDDSHYAVYAFCPNNDISQDVLNVLTERVGNVSLGTIRYECISYSQLQLWRGEKGCAAVENVEITGIAPEYTDIFIFPVADTVDAEYVIYAQKDDNHYIYPLTKKQASNIENG